MSEEHQNNITNYLNSWNKLDRYSQWIYHLYQNYIGKRVCDIGGGIGTAISYYIDRVDAVIATELFEEDVEIMNKRFSNTKKFQAHKLNIMQDDTEQLREFCPDTITCINCLEHIEDDVLAMKIMRDIVSEGGTIIICVPAGPQLYSYMDKNVGHFRRYGRGELQRKAKEAGLEIVDNYYMNMMGIIPYWLKGRFGKNKNASFSSSIKKEESKLYSLATNILEPLEKVIRPKTGISEFIILRKG